MQFGSMNENIEFPFLERLVESPDNRLTVFISPSKNIPPNADVIANEKCESLANILSGCEQMIPDDAQTYRIHFDYYIVYQVLNESYIENDPDEVFHGKWLLLCEKSPLLERFSNHYLVEARSHKIRHYRIVTQNHVIDVVSFEEPTVQKIQ